MLLINTQCGGKVNINDCNNGECAKCGKKVSVRVSRK